MKAVDKKDEKPEDKKPTLPEGAKMVGHRWRKIPAQKVSYDGSTYMIDGVADSARMVRVSVLKNGKFERIFDTAFMRVLYAKFKV